MSSLDEKLVLLKMLAEEATYNSTINTTFNRLLSIIQAHQAVEWVFKIILIEKVGIKEPDKLLGLPLSALLSMIEESQDSRVKEILNRYEVLVTKTENARDEAFRWAIVDIGASELVGGVQQMIRELCEKILEVRWDKISLVSAIKNQEWKEIAEEAESALRRNDYKEALWKSGDLVWLVLSEGGSLAGEMGRAWLAPVFEQDYQVIRDTFEPDKYAGRYTNPEVKALALDMSKAVYMLGFLVNNLALLNEEERLKYAKVVNILDNLQTEEAEQEQMLAPFAFEVFDFAVRLALKFEKHLRLSRT